MNIALGEESRNHIHVELPAHEAYGKKKIAVDKIPYAPGDIVKGVYAGWMSPKAVVHVTEITPHFYALDREVTVECCGDFYNHHSRKIERISWRHTDDVKVLWKDTNPK